MLKRELLIFGSEGALGKGVTKVMREKDFDKINLFDLHFDNIHSENKTVKFLTKDLSKEENVIAALGNIKPDKNTLYFLFSTIGGFYGGQTLWETNYEDLERMLSLNFISNFLIAKHFSWIVKLSGGGSMCFTSAFTADNPEELKAIYGASKSALSYMVKVLAKEGSRINLSVNAIAPFIIDTAANRKWMPEADFSKWIKSEEIGELVYSIFKNFNYVSGNILTLKDRFNV